MTKEKTKLDKQALILWKKKCFEIYGRNCELCGSDFRATPHHYYFRSSVPHLKFEILNCVILCCQCHAKLHFKDPKLVENEIVKVRGKKWENKIDKLAEKKMGSSWKTIFWYNEQINKLLNEK